MYSLSGSIHIDPLPQIVTTRPNVSLQLSAFITYTCGRGYNPDRLTISGTADSHSMAMM